MLPVLLPIFVTVVSAFSFQPRPKPQNVGPVCRRRHHNPSKVLVLSSDSGGGTSNPSKHGFENNMDGFPWDEGSSSRRRQRQQQQPSKADLYSNNELQDLLNLHQSLTDNGGFARPSPHNDMSPLQEEEDTEDPFSFAPKPLDGPVPFGLHDVVLQTLQDLENTAQSPSDKVDETTSKSQSDDITTTRSTSTSSYNISDKTKEVLREIRAIASDVDGTLISSNQTVHALTHNAVQRAVEEAFSPVRPLRYFFPATGKTRAALASLGPELEALLSQCPGVFVQGLYCVDGSGKVVYEQKLGMSQADAVIQFGETHGLTVLGYDGDKIFTTPQSNPQHVRDIHEVWGEPRPIVVDNMVGYKGRYHKCLVWCDDPRAITNTYRPQLEELTAVHNGTVTQAIPTMLEFLPNGASKARGVEKLCQHLGIDMSTELLAIGDAENDVGFLQEAAFGVAVGNAVPKAKAVADLVLEETNDQGGAGLAIDLFGLGGALQ